MWKDTCYSLIWEFNALHKQSGAGLLIKDTRVSILALATNNQVIEYSSYHTYSKHKQVGVGRPFYYVLMMRKRVGG